MSSKNSAPDSHISQHESNAETCRDGWQAVSRVVFPLGDQESTFPLYAIEWTRPHVGEGSMDIHKDMVEVDFKHMNESSFHDLLEDTEQQRGTHSFNELMEIKDRNTLFVRPWRHVSLCTFFNAFPAGYWRRWTKVNAVRFEARVQGSGSIMLFRSNGRGIYKQTATIVIDSPDAFTTVNCDLDMDDLMDGGFFWFDASSDNASGLTIADATWNVPSQFRRDVDGRLSIAITTFNRAPYCLDQLKRIASDHNVRSRLDTIYVVDQGTDLVRDQGDFPLVAKDLGNQLTYIRQNNMGGSGGFSRGMYETVHAGKSDYTMLLDDDAISEPEAIIRALQFGDYCKKPTIVGGGMFHIDNRTMLYTLAEKYNRVSFWAKPAANLKYNHDFAARPLRDSPELHRRADPDVNGWWMCLIPTVIMQEIGLAQPLFLKFDDFDYCLRAQEHGYSTVCIPGVAVWHQAWHAKEPTRTWEGYYLYRNHWICGLLHTPKPTWHTLYGMAFDDAKAGAELTYSAMTLHHMALRDIMRGPDYIAQTLQTKLAEVRKAREGYPDSTLVKDRDDFPEPREEYVNNFKPVKDLYAVRTKALKVIARTFLSRGNGMKDTTPELLITARDALWPTYEGVNSAIVTSPDGNSVAWLRRDSKLYRKKTMRGLFLAKELYKRWEKLSEEYRNSDIASIESWGKVFKNQA